MATLSVFGTQVSYTITGQGPGLALLHGTTSGGQDGFGVAVARFGQVRTVITIDYAGCSASTLPEGELTLDLLVEQAAGAIRDAGGGPVDLLGYSLGAGVAVATAAAYPDLVSRLVLIAGWATSDDPRHQMVFDTWSRLEAIDPALGVRYGLSLAFSPAFLEALGEARFRQALGRGFPPGTGGRLDLGRRIDLRGAAGRIAAPTLVVGLTCDCLVPSSHALRLQSLIPGSRYAELKSGHAVFLEKPDELVSLVLPFLTDAPRPLS